MTDFWFFLAKVPFVFMGLIAATALLAFLTANPDLQLQLAMVAGE